MCPNKKCFTTYRNVNGGKMLIDNDYSCKTVGLEAIRIIMHDGSIRMLMNVRHVPELRNNLFMKVSWTPVGV